MTAKYRIYTTIIAILITLLVLENFYDYKRKIFQWLYPTNHAKIFTNVYLDQIRLNNGYIASNPQFIPEYLALLQEYFNDDRFNTIVDFGCGDWGFMTEINIPDNKLYVCYEVVQQLVESNRAKFGKENVLFYYSPSLEQFAQKSVNADLLIVKDVMQHWPNNDIKYFMDNILPKYPNALITNYYTDNERYVNQDIKLGNTRPVDLTKYPFQYRNLTPILDYAFQGEKVFFYSNPKR